jgi:hypothetical protein
MYGTDTFLYRVPETATLGDLVEQVVSTLEPADDLEDARTVYRGLRWKDLAVLLKLELPTNNHESVNPRYAHYIDPLCVTPSSDHF